MHLHPSAAWEARTSSVRPFLEITYYCSSRSSRTCGRPDSSPRDWDHLASCKMRRRGFITPIWPAAPYPAGQHRCHRSRSVAALASLTNPPILPQAQPARVDALQRITPSASTLADAPETKGTATSTSLTPTRHTQVPGRLTKPLAAGGRLFPARHVRAASLPCQPDSGLGRPLGVYPDEQISFCGKLPNGRPYFG